MTQFRRLLERIAEENQKVFGGKVLSVANINEPEGCQMGKLRMADHEPQIVSGMHRPKSGCTMQPKLQVNSN